MFRGQKSERAKIDVSTFRVVAPKLLSLAREEWRTLSIGMAALAAGSGINLLFPALVRKFLKGEFGLSIENNLSFATAILILLFAIQSLCFYVRTKTFLTAGLRVVYRLRQRLFANLLKQEIRFYDNASSAELLTRLSSDCQLVQNAVSMNISVFLRYAVQVVGGLILMALISLRLTLLIVLGVPLLVLGIRFWGSKLQIAARKVQDALGRASVVAGERLAGIRIVKVFSQTERESEVYSDSLKAAFEAGVVRADVASEFSSVMTFILHSSIALVFFQGVSLVLDKRLDIGDLTAFLLYCAIVSASFGFLVGVVDEFLSAVGGAARVFELLERVPEQKVGTKGAETLNLEAPHLSFEGVSFSYGEGVLRPVLNEISFSVNRGQTIAIVGPSGSGKTTLLSLISKFYEPKAGSIKYFGTLLSELKDGVVEGELSVVTQEPILFSSSLAENIRYGRNDATDDEIRAAAEMANLGELLQTLPNGLLTEIGERGTRLSGGERQRVSIARAVLKNPRLLLLDEPTSSLDSHNEHLVQQALQRLMEGRTTIIVAHRLSTVQHADLIIVLQSGRIVESGNHRALMEQSGLYASLVRYQLL